MSDNSHIEWTDATWNFIRARRKDGEPNMAGGGWACQRVSPGCENCYAATINKRLGTGFDYDAKGVAASDVYLDEKALTIPLKWRTPRKVFVCSMTDLFAEWVPFEWIDRVFGVMALSPQHTFQLLTKRPERMREYLTTRDTRNHVAIASWPFTDAKNLPGIEMRAWPLPNCWLGTSVENQHWADIRIPELLATPAAVHWVSYEPALGPVDFRTYFHESTCALQHDWTDICTCSEPFEYRVGWVVCGGESGLGARPFDIAWARSVVEQCRASGVACFVKQLGAKPFTSNAGLPWADEHPVTRYRYHDRKGGDMSEWPEDLRVREMPV